MRRLQRFKSRGRRAVTKDTPDPRWLLEPADIVLAQIGKLKYPAEQLAGGGRNQDLVGTSQRLQACREIRRFPDQRKFRRRTVANQVARHNHAAGNPDADFQALHAVKRRYGFEDFQRSIHGPFSVAFPRGGKTEIGKDAVAQETRDVAVKKPDRVGARALELKQDVAQVLRIKLGGQRRRANQIAKQNGQMSPFGPDCGGCAQLLDFVASTGGGRAAIFGDRLQQFFSMSQRDAELFKILLVEAGENLAVDVVFAEKIGVLAQANGLKPMPEVRHFAGKRV